MKRIFHRLAFLAVSALIAAAQAATHVALPPVQYADTETTTNVPFMMGANGRHTFRFALSFAGTPSNNVEVALGVDANSDGMLSAGETELVVGWDCGRWFLWDFANALFWDRWSHTSRWGAGRWIGVGAGNLWCVDQTRMMVGCWVPPWMQGEMTWAIPIGWNENGTTSGTDPIKSFPVEYSSIWTIDSQGTMTKQKHGHVVSRTTNDVVHLDGVLVP